MKVLGPSAGAKKTARMSSTPAAQATPPRSGDRAPASADRGSGSADAIASMMPQDEAPHAALPLRHVPLHPLPRAAEAIQVRAESVALLLPAVEEQHEVELATGAVVLLVE